MADLLQQLNQNIGNPNFQRKLLLLLILAGTIGGAAVLYLWTQKTDYQILYSHLSSEDAGAIVQKLKETGTEYRLSENGTSILAPSGRVAELRLEMAPRTIQSEVEVVVALVCEVHQVADQVADGALQVVPVHRVGMVAAESCGGEHGEGVPGPACPLLVSRLTHAVPFAVG